MSGPQGPDPTQPWQGQDQPAGGTSEPQQPSTESPSWQPPSGDQGAPEQSGWQPPAYTAPQPYSPYQAPPSTPGYAQPPQYVPQPSTPGYGQQPPQYGQQPPQYGQQQYGQPGQYPPPGQPQYGQPGQYGQPQFPQPGQYPVPGQPYGQQPGQYGQPPFGQPGAVEGSKRSTAAIGTILGVLAAIVVAVVLILGFWMPGWFVTTKLDVAKAQSGVQQILSDQANGYGAKNVQDVKCNNGESPTVKKGDTFNCEVSIDGTKRQVTVTFQDDKGTYEVGRPK
ncbi:hypothetical protein BH09ACT8_BH09ACT8_27010 [soil metagenome]